MKKSGFAPALIFIVFAVLCVFVYFLLNIFFKSPVIIGPILKSSDIQDVFVTHNIDKWITKVKWEDPTSGLYFSTIKNKEVEGYLRKGLILNSDKAGNPYNIDDLLPDINKRLDNLGYKLMLPVGASGPNVSLLIYNKIQKILIIKIEVDSDVKCPCINMVTIFQEK